MQTFQTDLTKKNPSLLITFIGGWIKHALENPTKQISALEGNMAGFESLIKVYSKNKASGMKKDKRKRLFYNTSWWRYGSREAFDKIDKSNMLTFDIGTYYPLKGLSNNELASLASSQHLCQGFGRLSTRGTQTEYIEFLKGDPMINKDHIFEGIDTSWNRVKGGQAVGNILNALEENFNFQNPATHLSDLVEAYKFLQQVEDNHWRTQKTKELKTIIEMCAGLYLEASAETNWATQNEPVNLNIEVLNRSTLPILLQSINNARDLNIVKNITLENNVKYNFKEPVNVTSNANTTTPYWLNEKGSLGMYKVTDPTLIGKPETPRVYTIDFNVLINNTPITFTKPIIQRFSKPDKGELYRPLSITHKGEEQTLVFTVIPPNSQSEGFITPMVHIIQGAGDVVPESLEQIGYHVQILKPEDINPETLSKFDAVVGDG